MICFELDHPTPVSIIGEFIRVARTSSELEQKQYGLLSEPNRSLRTIFAEKRREMELAIAAISQSLAEGVAYTSGDATISVQIH